MWVRNQLANPVVPALGHSRAHRLLGRRLVLLSYCGRRTGHRHEIPVMTAAAGEDLVVVAADPEAKTWWRNFGVEPTDVLICVNGRDEPRTARRFAPGEPGYSEALAAYRRTFPGVPATSGEPVVVLAPRAH